MKNWSESIVPTYAKVA